MAVPAVGKGLRSHIISLLERIFLDTEKSEFVLCNRITSAQLARNWTTRLVPGIASWRGVLVFWFKLPPQHSIHGDAPVGSLRCEPLCKIPETSKGSGQQSCWIIHHIYNDDEAHTHIHSSICVRCLENGHFLCWRAESVGHHRFTGSKSLSTLVLVLLWCVMYSPVGSHSHAGGDVQNKDLSLASWTPTVLGRPLDSGAFSGDEAKTVGPVRGTVTRFFTLSGQ